MTSDSGLLEDAGPRPSRLRRLWFRLLLLFRRVARLFGGREAAQPSAPAGAEAYAFERVPAGPPFDEVNHPLLRRLRRRALVELFDWLDLAFVPGQLLERSDHSGDPVAALALFLRSVGCDPDRVRRREPEELARLGEVIDLLMAFDSLTARLAPAQRDELQLLFFAGDFERLRRVSKRLFALCGLLDAHEAQASAKPLAAYDALAGRVKAALGRLPSLSEAEVAAFRAEAERWLRLARRRDLLSAEIAAQRAALERAAAPGPRDAAVLADIHAIETALAIDPGLDGDAVARQLDALDDLLAALQSLVREREAEAEEAAARFRSEAATERLYRSEEEKALSFFGFPAEARPDGTAIHAAWRRFMKVHHPDLTTDPEEKPRREALCKEANLKRHVLERAFV